MERDHWNLGVWGGIPVSMHWTVLLSFAWLYLFLGDLVSTAIGAVALFVLFVAHEFGHVLVMRRRRVPVERIMLNGLHGHTEPTYASERDQAWIAWGGVGAQLVILGLAYAIWAGLAAAKQPLLLSLYMPVFLVFTRFNIFLIVIALLPIGPFDGAAAWRLFPMLRASWKRRRPPAPRKLTPQQQRELEAESQKTAAELINKLRQKAGESSEDA